jgi:hypothetical protein
VSPGDDAPLLENVPPELLDVASAPVSNQATASRAKTILCELDGFRDVDAAERSLIAAGFAARGFVVYGKAFDLVHLTRGGVDLTNRAALDEVIGRSELTLIEVKSTSANRDDEFRGHFFSMSTAELLVAQSLGERFKFAFVNTTTGNVRVVTLQDVYRRARAIYPTWSIRFDAGSFTSP